MIEVAIVTYIDRKSADYGIIDIDDLNWLNAIHNGDHTLTLEEVMQKFYIDENCIEEAEELFDAITDDTDYIPTALLMEHFYSIKELNACIEANQYTVTTECEVIRC